MSFHSCIQYISIESTHHFPPQLPPYPRICPLLTHEFFSYYLIESIQCCLHAQSQWKWCHPRKHGQLVSGHIHKKKNSPTLPAVHSSSRTMTPPCSDGDWLDLVWVLRRQLCCCEFLRARLCHIQKPACHGAPHHSPTYILFVPSSWASTVWCGGLDVRAPFRPDLLTVTYFLDFDHVSLCINLSLLQKEVPWLKQRAVLMCGININI